MIWLVIRIIFSLLPAIMRSIREQQARNASQEEIVNSIRKRVADASKAEPVDEDVDPYNRDNDPR